MLPFLQVFDASFTAGDLVVGIGVLTSVVFYIISYRKRYSGPTRDEFMSLKKEYAEHTKADLDFQDKILLRLNHIDVTTAVLSDQMVNLKQELRDQTTELKKDIRESLRNLKEDIRNK